MRRRDFIARARQRGGMAAGGPRAKRARASDWDFDALSARFTQQK